MHKTRAGGSDTILGLIGQGTLTLSGRSGSRAKHCDDIKRPKNADVDTMGLETGISWWFNNGDGLCDRRNA